ncbi:MAG: pyridoxamine 5'-phosphate oxidase family protein [Deltaproteobacteria bacterium]|nr:pyridoxamine 5'-phosphate oxidase family protein [Deltaproteobacteria bacterium]
MAEALRETILAYMREHNVLSLAVAGEDGPWAASLFYVNDGLTLYFLSDPLARHGQAVARDPRVAATINEDYREWKEIKGIQMEARCELVTSEAERLRAMALYIKKYPFVAAFFSPASLLSKTIREKVGKVKLYRLQVERVWFIDNEKGFGYREELPVHA